MKMAFPFLKDVPKPDAWLVFKKVKKKIFYRKNNCLIQTILKIQNRAAYFDWIINNKCQKQSDESNIAEHFSYFEHKGSFCLSTTYIVA